jgi:hypothetical protein
LSDWEASELFRWENHQRADADLHEEILSQGDHAAADAVSRAVAKRRGLSDSDVDALNKSRARMQ